MILHQTLHQTNISAGVAMYPLLLPSHPSVVASGPSLSAAATLGRGGGAALRLPCVGSRAALS